jgi:hypothetical protein
MFGISGNGKDSIGKIIDDIFDRIALQFIGNLPKYQNKKLAVFSSQENFGLSNLFVQAMQNKMPNALEQDVLRSLLVSADGYIESLKSKTRSNVTELVDGIVKEARIRNEPVDSQFLENAIQEEMGKASTHLKTVIESEATKLRNLGSMMDITRSAANVNDSDPTVFFIMVKDASTCKECLKLHMMPDGITPRLYKFSELKQGYHKRGETQPSAFGLHPHCRCTLTYLSRGFTFDKSGKLDYHSQDYDLYSVQRAV